MGEGSRPGCLVGAAGSVALAGGPEQGLHSGPLQWTLGLRAW